MTLNTKIGGFYGFFGDFELRVAFQEQIARKSIEIDIQGGPKRTGPVWAFITLRRLVVERCVICQKFHDVLQKKHLTCTADHLNIFA